jgi:peptidoglycan/LPS O-acetylase OafA/YrhL
LGARWPRFYRPNLDGLRFFAFLAVYLNHTLLLDPGRGALWKRLMGTAGTAGAFGVDLFLALSAYLITELLLREREARGTVDIPAFYARRALRIWPLYFVFLAAMLVVARLTPTERLTPRYAVAFGLFFGNWLYMAHPIRTMAAPLWSVSVEEQFYLLWPWIVRSGSRARIVAAAIGLAVAGLVTGLVLAAMGIGEPWLSKNSLVRADGIAAGALLAVGLRGRVPQFGKVASTALVCAAIAIFLLVAGTFDLFQVGVHAAQSAVGYPLIALASVAVLAVALSPNGSVGGLLRRPQVVFLGRISYGLYVFHQVGLSAADRLFPDYLKRSLAWGEHFAVGLACTVALATLSYFFLEQPFLRLKQRRFTTVDSRPVAVLAPELVQEAV